MNPNLKKWVVRPLLIGIISLGVLLCAGFIVLSTQQQRLVNLAVRELNNQVKGELAIEDSKISLFKNFPYISIGLHNGRFFADKTQTGNPICAFDRLYIGFSLPDLLQQKYDIRILFLKGGYLDLVQAKDGKINLAEKISPQKDSTIQITQTDTTSSFAIDLKKIIIKEMRVSYRDMVSGQKYSTQISKLVSSINMDSSQVTLAVNTNMMLDVTSDTDTTLFRKKSFST